MTLNLVIFGVAFLKIASVTPLVLLSQRDPEAATVLVDELDPKEPDGFERSIDQIG